MATKLSEAPHFEGPHPKRQKVSNTRKKLIYDSPAQSLQPEPEPRPAAEKSKESAFNFEPLLHSNRSSEDDVLDITNYIPIGCLRVCKDDVQVSSGIWLSQNYWAAFTLPKDVFNKRDGPFLFNRLQEILFESPILSPSEVLFNNGLIRMEFRTNDATHGQARVYLHSQIIHKTFDRHRRAIDKATRDLLRRVDLSNLTWAGKWSLNVPCSHIDPSLNINIDSDPNETLLSVFNILPSPDPTTDDVPDEYARQAMMQLLENNVYGLVTDLYPYQRRSAALMVKRESSPGQIFDPRLIKLVDQSGVIWYCDPDEGYANREPRIYEAARGGILAENMGLGKTLICLSLILATRDFSSTVPPQFSVNLIPLRKQTGSLLEMTAAALGRHAVPWKMDFAMAESEGYEYILAKKAIQNNPGNYLITSPSPPRSSRTVRLPPRKILLSTCTLVVVPANLLQQWLNEINKHTTGLKVLSMVHSQTPLPPAEDLLDYDIILFTKLRFDKEGKNLDKTPLRAVHFKRLIYDEGHTMGNSSASSQTEAFTIVNSLNLEARWIVSGTPTQGLYSTEESKSQAINGSLSQAARGVHAADKLTLERERNDLVKLGNIATSFLKARPWAASLDGDVASWSQYVLQPRHGMKSRGNIACLKSTLEGMMIKHRHSDVEQDVVLPPLYQSLVYLEPSLQNKLTLNLFNIMVITNAVTSERRDADYFFHPKQRKNLQSLVSNLREGSFFWSGFEIEHVQSTLGFAQSFLEKGHLPTSAEDIHLLQRVVDYGKSIVTNNIFRQISHWHEMPLFIENDLPAYVREALSLDKSVENPTLMSASMVLDAQKFVYQRRENTAHLDGLVAAEHKSMHRAQLALLPQTSRTNRLNNARSGDLDTNRKAPMPVLAGAVTVGNVNRVPKRLAKPSTKVSPPRINQSKLGKTELASSPSEPSSIGLSELPSLDLHPTAVKNGDSGEDNKLRKLLPAELSNARSIENCDPASLFESARIISTASTKLSYLLDRIVMHHEKEKILVFYESSNTAFYIAECLECLNIKHLIYAKELKSEKRAQYVVTFNSTETFRVLLMDVSQAAFGLDMSSASRVYFISPVFSPQVEAQAVKRAHRIGQHKPVYVETLVLIGSIEEAIVARREVVSNEEHQKYKSILDDQTLYDWIRNIKLLSMSLEDVSGPDQMALLQSPQKVFGNGSGSGFEGGPDADILKIDHLSAAPTPSHNGYDDEGSNEEDHTPRQTVFASSFIPRVEAPAYIGPTDTRSYGMRANGSAISVAPAADFRDSQYQHQSPSRNDNPTMPQKLAHNPIIPSPATSSHRITNLHQDFGNLAGRQPDQLDLNLNARQNPGINEFRRILPRPPPNITQNIDSPSFRIREPSNPATFESMNHDNIPSHFGGNGRDANATSHDLVERAASFTSIPSNLTLVEFNSRSSFSTQQEGRVSQTPTNIASTQNGSATVHGNENEVVAQLSNGSSQNGMVAANGAKFPRGFEDRRTD